MNSIKYFYMSFFTLSILLFTSNLSLSQTEGETIFTQTCRACHTIGEGKLVGPDLYNVAQRRSEAWLVSFIKSSQTLINNNDADAVAIFNEFNKVIMPDQNLTDTQIKNLLDYITQKSATTDTSKTQSLKVVFRLQNKGGFKINELGKSDLIEAQNLFSGETRLINDGPSCISCHNVVNDNLLSGGLLAKDLTTAFSRLGGESAVNSIISNSPFPAMNAAYKDNPITPDEAFLLTAFLYSSEKDSVYQNTTDYKGTFLNTGLIASAMLFGFYGIFWWNRKRRSVNHDIYKRQLKTK